MSEDGRDRALQRAAPIESNGRDNDGEAKRTRLQPHDNIEIRPEQHHNLVWSDAAVKEKAQSTSTEVVASAVSTNDSNGKAKNSSADGTLGNHVDKVKPSRRKKSKSSPRGPLAQDNAIDLTAPLEARGPPVEIVIHDDDDDDIPVTSTVQLGTDSTTLSRQGTSSSSDSRVVMAPTKATAPSPSRAHLSTRSKHTPSGRRRRGRPRKLVDEPSVVDLNHDATVPAVILIHDSDDSDNANNVPTNESPRSSSIPPNPTPPLASLEDLLPPQGVDVPVVEGEQPTAPALVDDAQRNRILGNAVEALVADMPLLLGDDFTPLVDAVTLAALSNVDSSRAMVSSVLDGLPEDDDISNTLSLALGEDAPVACAAAAQGGDSSVPEDQDIHTERSAAQVEECFTSVELSTAQPAVEELSPQSLEAMPAPVDNGDMLRACKDKVEVATEEHRVDQALDSTVDITENVDGIRFHEQQPPSPTIVQTLAPAQNNVVCQSSSAVADALLLLPEGPLPSATPPLDPTEETPATVYSSCVSKPFFKAEPTVVATTMAKGDDETATGVPHQRKRKRVPAADPGGDQIDLPTGEAKESASSIGPADDEMSSEGYLSENDVGDSDSEIGDGKPDEAIRDDDGMPCPSPSAPFFPGPRKEVMPYVGTEPEASAQAAPLASPQRDEVDNAAPSPDKPCQVTEKDAVGADTPLPSLYDRPQFPCKELLIAEAFDESDKSMEPHENASDSDDDSAPPPPPPSPQVPPPRRLPLVDLTNTPPPASPLRLQAKQLPPHIYNANPPSHASATTSSSSSSNSSSSDSEGDRPVAPPDHPHRYAKQVADLLLSENEGDDDENDEDDVEFGGSDEPTDQVDSDSSDVVFVGVVPAASSGHAAAEPHGRPLESVHPVLRGMYQVAAHEATWTGTWGFTETTASAPTKFTYKCIAPHWSSHDLRVPINGVYNGYFVMISDGHGRPHRVLERGVHLEFTELAPGSYVVDGSGRNKFGPFSLRGYYQWGNPLTLVKVYTRPA
ncbi:hypothetical protein DYB32_003686 [Aphanomyces invadans]|uniref:Uncharacterized protein n=1 Tax=Aphanomyces invadans TaxID=157072 RepID=A0A418AZZ6_9STRA|nr:hypothetical protein DYB32_003686 [Aphanomyces invadans]